MMRQWDWSPPEVKYRFREGSQGCERNPDRLAGIRGAAFATTIARAGDPDYGFGRIDRTDCVGLDKRQTALLSRRNGGSFVRCFGVVEEPGER
jgi:hypothetical protein